MEKPVFVYVTYIQTTLERLWKALTSTEFTRQYWGGHAIESEWTVGAPVLLRKEDGTINVRGQILACDPPKLLSYSWESQQHPEPASRVTFELATMGEVVKLTCTHAGFAPESKLKPLVSQGWPAILSSLKSLVETQKPLAFPPWRG
jgi:uncharacterized protein YndB with AHSA1/START domain